MKMRFAAVPRRACHEERLNSRGGEVQQDHSLHRVRPWRRSGRHPAFTHVRPSDDCFTDVRAFDPSGPVRASM